MFHALDVCPKPTALSIFAKNRELVHLLMHLLTLFSLNFSLLLRCYLSTRLQVIETHSSFDISSNTTAPHLSSSNEVFANINVSSFLIEWLNSSAFPYN